MNFFTQNSPYYHLLKYLLFLLKHPVYIPKARTGTTSPFWTLISCHQEISNNDIYNRLSPIKVCTSVFLKGGSIIVRQVTKWRAGRSGVRILAGTQDFSQNTRPALEPTQPPNQLLSEAISPGRGQGDWLQHDVHHLMCLDLRLRISGAIPLLPPPGLHFMDRYNVTITACFVVNSVSKYYDVLLNFYDFVHPSFKPMASKLIHWNPDFTWLMGAIKMNVKSRKM